MQEISSIVSTSAPLLAAGRRMRRTPYTARVEAAGCRVFSVYNHMLLPEVFRGDVEDYHHLKTHVQVWDVGCERQVQIRGRDAASLVQRMTCRDISRAVPGQCLYVPLVDEHGGMVNDPVMLKFSDEHYWLSIADSDVLLWAKGLAAGLRLDVECREPAVWPLAVQGPKAEDLVARLFGDEVRRIRFFRFATLAWQGHPLTVARSGWSKQGGFEIYVNDWALGERLWDACFDAGRDLDVGPGAPHNTERIEGGLLSYGNDFDNGNNPFEIGLEKYVHLDRDIDFVGRRALAAIRERGVTRRLMGVFIEAMQLPACEQGWPVFAEEQRVGEVTSASVSPAFGEGIGYAMLDRSHWNEGTALDVLVPNEGRVRARVTPLPFIAPRPS